MENPLLWHSPHSTRIHLGKELLGENPSSFPRDGKQPGEGAGGKSGTSASEKRGNSGWKITAGKKPRVGRGREQNQAAARGEICYNSQKKNPKKSHLKTPRESWITSTWERGQEMDLLTMQDARGDGELMALTAGCSIILPKSPTSQRFSHCLGERTQKYH